MIKHDILIDLPKRVKIIGVPISAVNMNSCIEFLFLNWEAIHGNYMCVANVHTTVMAHDNPSYFEVQANSLLSVPDGKPLSVIGRRQFPEMERVTGPDFMRRVFAESRTRTIRHYFYGTKKEDLQALLITVQQDYPWVEIVGAEPSVFRPMSKEEEEQLADRINAAKPDFVWIALGAPRQEQFCYRMEGKIQGLMVGVGGAFHVIAGTIPEAPRWMQDCCLEWMYRLIQEPKRLLKRYVITNWKFVMYLVRKT